jgi:hypothetical protein
MIRITTGKGLEYDLNAMMAHTTLVDIISNKTGRVIKSRSINKTNLKKYISIAALVLLISLVSCDKDSPEIVVSTYYYDEVATELVFSEIEIGEELVFSLADSIPTSPGIPGQFRTTYVTVSDDSEIEISANKSINGGELIRLNAFELNYAAQRLASGSAEIFLNVLNVSIKVDDVILITIMVNDSAGNMEEFNYSLRFVE